MLQSQSEQTLAEQGYRHIERLGQRFLILASLGEKNYMLFIEAEEQKNVAVWVKGKGYEFVRPITDKWTRELYVMAQDADTL